MLKLIFKEGYGFLYFQKKHWGVHIFLGIQLTQMLRIPHKTNLSMAKFKLHFTPVFLSACSKSLLFS